MAMTVNDWTQLFTQPGAASPLVPQVSPFINAAGQAGWQGLSDLLLGAPGHPVRNFFTGPLARPATAAPAPTGPVPQLNPQAVPQPMIPRTFPSPRGGTEMSIPVGDAFALPPPPMLPMPPQMTAPGGPNFSKAREALSAAAPKDIDQKALNDIMFSEVLAGLAGGAGSVDATEAGSFAKALAKAGAGGMGAKGASQRYGLESKLRQDDKKSNYQLKVADFEKDAANSAASHARSAAEIAFRNAQLNYQTNVQNMQTQYEYQGKKREQMLPVIKATADGITIQQYNPQTKAMDLKVVPTKNILGQAESIKNIASVMNMDGPAAESISANWVIDTMKGNPAAAEATLKRMTVDRVLQMGSGGAVFGKLYEAAFKEAKNRVPAELAAKPEAYLKAIQDHASAMIFNALQAKGDNGWLNAAAKAGSVTAGILTGGATPSTVPTQPTTVPRL